MITISPITIFWIYTFVINTIPGGRGGYDDDCVGVGDGDSDLEGEDGLHFFLSTKYKINAVTPRMLPTK
jgi:hypothetical protein